MSLEAARKLSIPELLRVLGEKLDIEYSRVRQIPTPLAVSLEVEIESLETQAHDILRFIQSLRNRSLPVNRLPPEIISYIARCILREDYVVDTRPIIPLTHVCRYWRDSIISMPDNWTLISSEWMDLTALSLERAKAAPLTICLDLNEDPGFLDLLLPHHQSIRSLWVTPTTFEELTRALPNLSKSMPNLRSLRLGGSGQDDWAQAIDPFDFSAHTLGELSLYNIPLYPSFLSLRSLTKLNLVNFHFNLHLDTLLDFLEENHSLESVKLEIWFAEPSLHHSRRQDPIGNRLKRLSISSWGEMAVRALLSAIALRRGAALEVRCGGPGLVGILSGVSVTHLRNLSSPTFMEYRAGSGVIRLVGPEGSFTYGGGSYGSKDTFREFPLLPLDNIREFRLICRELQVPEELHQLTFPSLEVLVIRANSGPPVFPDSITPSLKTLAFLNCVIPGGFMAALTRFASRRVEHTLAPLQRVVIVYSSDDLSPSEASIAGLRRHVPVVEVIKGRGLPKDMLW